MSSSNAASDTVAIREKIAFYILIAFCVGLIGVAMIESSDSSILLKRLLEVDYRLLLSMVVFAGAGILGSLIWMFDRMHPFYGWFSPRCDDLPSPTVQRFHRASGWWKTGLNGPPDTANSPKSGYRTATEGKTITTRCIWV